MSDRASGMDWQELRHPDVARRRTAARGLAQAESAVGDAAGLLLEAVADADEEVREWSVAALESLGPPPLSLLPELRRQLTNTNADIAYWSATLLGRLRADAGPAVADLVRSVASEKRVAVRERAVWALGQIGPAAREAIPQLQPLAQEGTGRLSRLAQEAITAIGQNAARPRTAAP